MRKTITVITITILACRILLTDNKFYRIFIKSKLYPRVINEGICHARFQNGTDRRHLGDHQPAERVFG